jgi:hypothetical protein
MIEAKLLKVEGKAAVVKYRDYEGMIQARIISYDDVRGLRINETKIFPNKIINSGTEYGIDWEVLFGEECAITPKDIEQEFRRRGLWTYDDINRNPNHVIASLTALSAKVHKRVIREAKLED